MPLLGNCKAINGPAVFQELIEVRARCHFDYTAERVETSERAVGPARSWLEVERRSGELRHDVGECPATNGLQEGAIAQLPVPQVQLYHQKDDEAAARL